MSNAALIAELRSLAWGMAPIENFRTEGEYGEELVWRAVCALEAAEAPPFVQQMIDECLPGGSSCDPQHVADAIRAWAKARGLE
jgi:hypothetical protein